MSLDPTKVCIFNQSIIISNSGEDQTNTGTKGQLRFNQTNKKFEGYHSDAGADIFGNAWRSLTQDVASTSNLGVFRVGSNLQINPTTGILSSIASGSGRINQLVITVSPIIAAADFTSINEAISNAIGTPSGGYIDGSITNIIGSAPSPTYPFIIQLAPGQYSEPLNQIIIPDYVTLIGADNYNSVITQNAGNIDEYTGSMIVLGQNSEICNLAIILADKSNSQVSNAIYSLNKSNFIIDSCIFTCNTNITTTSSTYYMHINGGGNTNTISNCQFLTNTSTLTGNFTAINITNSTPRLINNKIDTLTPNALSTIGINIGNTSSNWNETESILDKTYIENITLSNNYYNTVASNNKNIGICLNNSPITLKNSDIEVSTNQSIGSNYGIDFNSSIPLINTISSNIISFINNTSNSTINSANSSIVNFVTLGFQRGQYISISGSQYNDGIYKIYRVLSTTSIILDASFQAITESANISNTITIKALYNVDIFNSKINTLGNYTIYNYDSNSNYVFNINNLINEGKLNISPSATFYTNYKTITVGKVNCDFNSLQYALNSITDNTSNTRYNIKVESGIYQENNYITCKPYINIEGNGQDNTTILFNQASDTSGTPYSNTSCFLLASNMRISNLKIKNESTLYTSGKTTTTVLYNPSSIINFTLENIIIDSTCSSVYNTGIYLDNTGLITTSSNEITIRNVNIIINSNLSALLNVGIYANNCNNFNCYSTTINTQSSSSSNNYAIYVLDSEFNIYNSSLYSDSGTIENIGIKTNTSNTNQKLIQIYNGQIRVQNGIDYSVYADNYYTIVCNNIQILGDTHTNTISSRVFCCGCYSFNNATDKLNTQSLNSRGQNEQSQYDTITIGDSAGKLNASGTENVIIGVNAGSNITTGSYSTIIGANAGSQVTTANNNVLLGSNAGNKITTGSFNTITGSNAAISMITGGNNIITGSNAGNSITSGNNNTLIGNETAKVLETGNLNVFLGTSTGLNTTTSNNNILIGAYSGSTNQSGNDNTYIGFQSGNASILANDNIMIGKQAGYNNLSSGIVAIGNYAGYNNTNNIKNTYLGFQSGYNTTSGDGNTFLGNNSGYSAINSSAAFNTSIGNEAGYSLTSGSRNVLMGATTSSNGTSNDSAGWALTSGNDNVHIGVSSGNSATSASNNVLIGSTVGTTITTASNNVIIGENTGNALNNTGQSVIIGSNAGNDYNVGNGLIVGYNAGSGYTGGQAFALGYQSGSNVTGNFNMFMGYNSAGLTTVNTSGDYNIAIGPYTGYNLSSGSQNVIVGSGDSTGSAGKLISTGSNNTLVGFKAGSALQTGGGNTLIGSNAGPNLTSGIDNLVLGYQSAFNLNSGSYNIVLGPKAGYNLSTGNGNIYSGYQSGYNNATGSYNINMGYQSGYASTNNNYNIHLGHQSGYNSQADNNLFLGYQSGLNNTVGTNNIFIGSGSGVGNNANNEQIGNNNIFLGVQSGYSNDNGYSNIFLGTNAGESNIDGSKNIFIGENAGSTSSTSHNIFIGNASSNTAGIGYLSTGIGQNNVFIGSDVGIANTTGNKNIFLGDQAGMHNVDGVENIYIGTNAGQNADATSANYNIAIGSDAGINNQSGRENILIGRQVAGLATSTNYNQNIIIGTDAGQNIQQDNQIFIGTNAGQLNTTGDRNIFIGLNAGKTNINSPDNIVIGSDAGSSLIGSGGIGDNVLIGSQAGQDLTTGTNNIYIGSGAGTNAVTSINNVVIGANAMNQGDADNVIMIGHNAGLLNEANNNICIGSNTGISNVNSPNNILIGNNTGISLVGASDGINYKGENILIGNNTGLNLETGVNNTFIGSNTGININTGNNNVLIGTNVMNNGDANNVVIIGNNAGYNNSADNVIFIGANAGELNNGINNIAIGYNALTMNVDGNNNICIGNNAGYSNNNSISDNIYIGSNSGVNSVTGNNNIGVGLYTLENNDSSSNNICIGAFVGQYINSSGSFYGDNVLIGGGRNLISGIQNIAVGLGFGDGDSASGNVVFGFQSGFYTNSDYNIYIGHQSGNQNVSGINNCFIGFWSGFFNGLIDPSRLDSNNCYLGNRCGQSNIGSNNTFIGYELVDDHSDFDAPNIHPYNPSYFNNTFGIYNNTQSGITSDTTVGTLTILLGGNFTSGTVGIGTITPDNYIGSPISETATKLVVLGKVLANAYTTFTGSHNVIIDLDSSVNINSNNLLEGMIMSSTGVVVYSDINNTVVNVIPSNVVNDKKVYGIYCGNEIVLNDDRTEIVSTTYYVNSLGEGGILVTNYGGNIGNGDYITTCPISGYGALQNDDVMYSYTVAKCTQNINWDSITTTINYNGTNYKYTMASCTYHCG